MSVSVGNIRIDTRILDKMTAEAKPKARRIVEQYGRLVQASAITRAPYKTGNLQNTISSNSKMIADMTFRVQDGTEYGLRLELGFHGEDSLGRIYNQAARPFMFPALEQYREAFKKAFAELFR